MPVKPSETAPEPMNVCDSSWSDKSLGALIQAEDILSICWELQLDTQQ